MIQTVIKRDGRKVDYNLERIVSAIEKAEKSLNQDVSIAKEIAKKVEIKLNLLNQTSVSIEEIQDIVVKCLKENHA